MVKKMEKEEKKTPRIISYLKDNAGHIAFIATIILIFDVILLLYNIEIEIIAYATIVCLFVSVIVFMIKLSIYAKRAREREVLIKNIENEYINLPEPASLADENYQQMIVNLGNELKEVLTDWKNEKKDSEEYYTTWIHQIKTPISVMRMILESEDTDEHRELLAELFRVEQYVEMVLCYIRLGSESKDFVFKEVDVDIVIKQAVRKYASQFIRRRIKLDYNSKSFLVTTDEKWLSFVIEQILSNSVKYTKQGEVRIEITDDGKLVIADTGIGISSEDLPRIFEKGYTGYNGRLDKKATGLGLYLCKKAIDKLGFKISAESEPKVGTKMIIDLKHYEFDEFN